MVRIQGGCFCGGYLQPSLPAVHNPAGDNPVIINIMNKAGVFKLLNLLLAVLKNEYSRVSYYFQPHKINAILDNI